MQLLQFDRCWESRCDLMVNHLVIYSTLTQWRFVSVVTRQVGSRSCLSPGDIRMGGAILCKHVAHSPLHCICHSSVTHLLPPGSTPGDSRVVETLTLRREHLSPLVGQMKPPFGGTHAKVKLMPRFLVANVYILLHKGALRHFNNGTHGSTDHCQSPTFCNFQFNKMSKS